MLSVLESKIRMPPDNLTQILLVFKGHGRSLIWQKKIFEVNYNFWHVFCTLFQKKK